MTVLHVRVQFSHSQYTIVINHFLSLSLSHSPSLPLTVISNEPKGVPWFPANDPNALR